MHSIFDITGKDIAQLKDDDLRDLIGLLCEADYLSQGLPTRGITWGGNQTAPDGGLDVVVRDNVEPPQKSHVIRKFTGFQVKKPDMPHSKIIKEMRPKGILRESIRDLINEKGAYIIVSAQGSTADIALGDRRQAMKEAVQDVDGHEDLYLDFMDCGRVATWVRKHPSLILWVRNKVNRPLQGWRPYENWSFAPGGIDEEYLLGDAARLISESEGHRNELSTEAGIVAIRQALSQSGQAVRLVGLSGTGKTRLVQALFDARIGDNALAKTQVIYADFSDDLIPSPQVIAEQLINSYEEIILVIDNCPPDVHAKLEKLCCVPNSKVKLLTVEYDVRDDRPEQARVFRLKSASEEVIRRLIETRFDNISQVDAQTIAEFSGGNARIAIALASTLKGSESLAGLRNEELFLRLFQQRHDEDKNLLESAEVCALVYSFNGEDTDDNSELELLASLVEKSTRSLYRDVNELMQRGLVQSRAVWRAVLPQAIANRLAARALKSILKSDILQCVSSNERLLKSFSRRLGYLHESEVAREIVEDWLADDGLIGQRTTNFRQLDMTMLRNIAPVAPEIVLAFIKRVSERNKLFFCREKNEFATQFASLLQLVAYDSYLFRESVELLSLFALTESKGENVDSTRDLLKKLFQLHFSGTHASVELRASFVEALLHSKDSEIQRLGFDLIKAALESSYFRGHGYYELGARSRDFGYRPQSREDERNWYSSFLEICTRLGLSDTHKSQEAREILAEKFRGLWTYVRLFDILEEKARALHEQKAWNEGWLAVRSVMQYDGNDLFEESLKRLQVLEEYLRPSDLLQQARTYIGLSGSQQQPFFIEDTFDQDESPLEKLEKAEEKIYETGCMVAQDGKILDALLSECLSGKPEGSRLIHFGRGLFDNYDDKRELWQKMRTELEGIPHEERNFDLVKGFLVSCAKSNDELYSNFLDEAVGDSVLGECYPYFEITSPIDQRGVERLHRALDLGKVAAHMFAPLANGGMHESIADDDLAGLLTKVAAKEKGLIVALDILGMRFLDTDNNRKHSQKILQLSCSLISSYTFVNQKDYDHLGINRIANVCLVGDEHTDTARQVCEHLAKAVKDNRKIIDIYFDVLEIFAKRYPKVLLDVFVFPAKLEDSLSLFRLKGINKEIGDLIHKISLDKLIEWCYVDAKKRYPLILSVVNPIVAPAQVQHSRWRGSDFTNHEFNPVLHDLLNNAPDISEALEQIAQAAVNLSSVWHGTYLSFLESRTVVFDSFLEHNNEDVRKWAVEQRGLLEKRIQLERDNEAQRSREQQRFESFE